jgi:hypothetical protein
MYATIRRYSSTTNTKEIVDRARKEFIPLVRQISGFQSYHILDAGNGIVATISMFNDKTGADESVRAAAEWIRSAGLSAQLPNPPEITSGEAFSS